MCLFVCGYPCRRDSFESHQGVSMEQTQDLEACQQVLLPSKSFRRYCHTASTSCCICAHSVDCLCRPERGGRPWTVAGARPAPSTDAGQLCVNCWAPVSLPPFLKHPTLYFLAPSSKSPGIKRKTSRFISLLALLSNSCPSPSSFFFLKVVFFFES